MTYEQMTDYYEEMDRDTENMVTFQAGYRKYNEIVALYYTQYALAEAIDRATTWADFGVETVENNWDNIVNTLYNGQPSSDITAQSLFDSWDANGDANVTEQELCRAIIGWAQCGPDPGYSHDDNHEMDDNEAQEQWRQFLFSWYRVDTDQNEEANESDLRSVRDSAKWSDAQVSAEFNHYDTDGDGIVQFEEAWNQKKADDEAFSSWFNSFDMDGDKWTVHDWEFTSDLVGFEEADSNGDWKLEKHELCPHFFSEYPSVCSSIENNGNDIAEEEFIFEWYTMDSDRDESASFDDVFAWTRTNGNMDWMNEDEVKFQIFDVYDTDSDGKISFEEGIAGLTETRSQKWLAYQIWEIISTNWQYHEISAENVSSTWDNLDEDKRLGAADVTEFFQKIDLDQNGSVSFEEACTGFLQSRYNCIWESGVWEYNWKMDLNLDGKIPYEEFTRSFGNHGQLWKHKKYYFEWWMKDVDADYELNWSHINEMNTKLEYVKQAWNSTLEENNIAWDSKVTSAVAQEHFQITDTEVLEDGFFTVHEYCMKEINVKVVCYDDIQLTIDHYDTDGDNGVNYEEFSSIMDEENDMENEPERKLMFHLYDDDNDGVIKYDEVHDVEENLKKIGAFNATNFIDASWNLMDINNNTQIDSEEFAHTMNFLLRITDQDQIDDLSRYDTAYEQVFPGGESESNHMHLVLFMKELLGRGIRSYIDENEL